MRSAWLSEVLPELVRGFEGHNGVGAALDDLPGSALDGVRETSTAEPSGAVMVLAVGRRGCGGELVAPAQAGRESVEHCCCRPGFRSRPSTSCAGRLRLPLFGPKIMTVGVLARSPGSYS